jgi:hypothetical protein
VRTRGPQIFVTFSVWARKHGQSSTILLRAVRIKREGVGVSAPTENRPDACVVSILDWLRNKRSSAQDNKLEQLVNLLNEIVAEGVLPAL